MNNLQAVKQGHPLPLRNKRLNMLFMKKQNIYMWVLLHFVLGFFVSRGNPISTFWALGTVAVGMVYITKTRNRTGMAHCFAAYITGLELFLRMTKADVFWEFGKYACILFLAMGLFYRYKIHNMGKVFFGYFFLLLPSVFLADSDIAGKSFGDSIENGRLVQLFFWRAVPRRA